MVEHHPCRERFTGKSLIYVMENGGWKSCCSEWKIRIGRSELHVRWPDWIYKRYNAVLGKYHVIHHHRPMRIQNAREKSNTRHVLGIDSAPQPLLLLLPLPPRDFDLFISMPYVNIIFVRNVLCGILDAPPSGPACVTFSNEFLCPRSSSSVYRWVFSKVYNAWGDELYAWWYVALAFFVVCMS